jgi:hypothetical protein
MGQLGREGVFHLMQIMIAPDRCRSWLTGGVAALRTTWRRGQRLVGDIPRAIRMPGHRRARITVFLRWTGLPQECRARTLASGKAAIGRFGRFRATEQASACAVADGSARRSDRCRRLITIVLR